MKMKTAAALFYMAASFFLAMAGAVEAAPRDPFWPVGYVPQEPEKAVVVEEVPEVAVTTTPVTQEEWDLAKATIPRAGGIFVGEHPVTRERVDKMLLSRMTYYAGDTICITNDAVAFTWKIDYISFKSNQYGLSPVSAVRLSQGRK